MKIFITGGGGFLGLAIVRQLCDAGHKVVSFSRKDYNTLHQLGVTQFQGDISEYTLLKEAMMGCDAVFHVAAKTGTWGITKIIIRRMLPAQQMFDRRATNYIFIIFLELIQNLLSLYFLLSNFLLHTGIISLLQKRILIINLKYL